MMARQRALKAPAGMVFGFLVLQGHGAPGEWSFYHGHKYGDGYRRAASCAGNDNFAVLGEPCGVAKGLQDILALEVRIAGENFVNRMSGANLVHEHANSHTHGPNARPAAHDGRVLRDAVKFGHVVFPRSFLGDSATQTTNAACSPCRTRPTI